jgi:S-adenosylmethionine:diacylglycerol 3-amino-3-carboxypropyl transferase
MLISGSHCPFVSVDQATQNRSTRDVFMAEVHDRVDRPWWAKVAGAVGSSNSCSGERIL